MKLRSGKLIGSNLREALGDVGYDGEEELPGLSRQEAEELPEDLQPSVEEMPEEVVPKNDEQPEQPEGNDVEQPEVNDDEPLVGNFGPPQQRPKPDFGMCKIFVTLVLVVLLTSWLIGIF